MQLKKIEILKYKSINSTITINFNVGEPVTLIGKNGSGKTNILEALKRTFSNRNFLTFNRNIAVQAYYYFLLTKEERKKYFPTIDLSEEDGLIKVKYIDKEPTIRLVSSPAVQVCVKKFREEAETIFNAYKTASKDYIKALKKIEVEHTSEFMLYTQVDCQDNKGNLTYIDNWQIQETQRRLDEQLKSIKNTLDAFSEDYFKLDDYSYSRFANSFFPIELHTIVNHELKISPIIAKSLGITKKKLEAANLKLNESIKSINQALQNSYNEIQAQIQKFNKLEEDIKAVFMKADDDRYAAQETEETIRNRFMQDLKDSVFKNCYYIDNENTLLFTPSLDNQYNRHQASIENFQSQNPLLEAFNLFLLNNGAYRENESIIKFNEIGTNRRKTLINLINTEFLAARIPEFDKSEIKGLLLKEQNNQLSLCIIENDGTEINVNNTSLGRRWYLTYLLIKSILKPGDLLLIDEPAAFLHPQAQQEIKRELKELACSGIFVIYATHSPYMIPENWGHIYNVKNTEAGTQVTQFNSDDELSYAIKEELGITRSADILFNLDKTLLLVEGVADKACIEKFAKILGYDLSSFELLPCNGSPILDVTHLCIHKNLKFKALLDRDNLTKPPTWLAHKFGYKEYLDIIKNNKNCIFTPTNGERKCLEDCFADEDNNRYFFDFTYHDYKTNQNRTIRKISYEKITAGTQFKTETLNNFEQLFIQLGIPELDKENQ